MSEVITAYRHYLATLAFRLRRVTDGAPDKFADFNAGSAVRSPLEILRHMSELMYFARYLLTADDMPTLSETTWRAEIERFRSALTSLDTTLQSAKSLDNESLLKALQGPLADAMTHIGQLATLRRLAGAPLERISYAKANIEVGVLSCSDDCDY